MLVSKRESKKKMTENCPFHIFKIRFYDCKSHDHRKEIENTLANCGALLQDFRVNYKSSFHKEETYEWWFCTPELIKFLTNFKQTKYWERSNYASLLAEYENFNNFNWEILY